MSTDKIDPTKNPSEMPPKDVRTELTEEELAKVSGGESLSLNFTKIEYKNTTMGGSSETQTKP